MSRSLTNTGKYPVEKDNEGRCPECGSRYTETPDGVEVGHKYGCPNRPDRLPSSGGASSTSYYRGEDDV